MPLSTASIHFVLPDDNRDFSRTMTERLPVRDPLLAASGPRFSGNPNALGVRIEALPGFGGDLECPHNAEGGVP